MEMNLPIENTNILTVDFNGCENDQEGGNIKCSAVVLVSDEKKTFINGKVATQIAQKPITSKDSENADEEKKAVIVMWDLLKGLDNTTLIGTGLNNYKFKTISHSDNPLPGGVCFLYDVSDITVDAQIYTNDTLQLGIAKFNPPSKQLLYIVAEIDGYFPYYYNPITVEAGVSEIFISLFVCIVFLLI